MTPARSHRAPEDRAHLDAAPDASWTRTPGASPAAPAGARAGRNAAARRDAASPGASPPPAPRRRLDPRLYQIAILTALLLFGVMRLDFEVTPLRITVAIAACVVTQWVGMRLTGQRGFDPRSPLISALGLAMLLRVNSEAAMALAGAVTIAAKFALRLNGKHLFNPTNFGIVLMMLLGLGWVSPGQWGSFAFFAFLLACVGGLVVNRAERSDVTYAFLASYTGIVFGRALWLGQPLAIPAHHLENGAFLVFTFFMISDPRTTPDSRAGRVLFALLVAAGAAWIQFGLHRTNALLWALAATALATPLIDRLLPGRRHRWGAAGAPPAPGRTMVFSDPPPARCTTLPNPLRSESPTPLPAAIPVRRVMRGAHERSAS